MALNESLFGDDQPKAVKMRARGERLTFRANRGRGRHGWLRLTPAYSLHLVEDMIAHCSAEDRVLDPFCGTGTTALVCAQAGILGHTIDINPFLVWLANVKCASYCECDVQMARAEWQRILHAPSAGHKHAWIPPIKDVNKWWDPPILNRLAQIFEEIRQAELSDAARNLLHVAFCRAAIGVANVSFGHQSMSFKKGWRAPTLFEITPEEQLYPILERAGADILSDAGNFVHAGQGVAFQGDSRQVHTVVPRTDYSVVITSPPYPNRMSYIRELRPYMYWLGYLTTGRQAGELDWQAIGGTWGCATSNLTNWLPEKLHTISGGAYDEAVEHIRKHSPVLGTYVMKYFQDVIPHIQSLRNVLAPGARINYIVGNSRFYDVMLHTEHIYAAILRDQGFQDITIEVIRKRTSKKELFEYVVSAHA